MTPTTDGMPDFREPAAAQRDLMKRMEDQHMAESDRQIAAAALRDGETLADLLGRARSALQSTASLLEHYFAQRSK